MTMGCLRQAPVQHNNLMQTTGFLSYSISTPPKKASVLFQPGDERLHGFGGVSLYE